MSATTKNIKNVPGDSPVCGKSRSNRLARRARSFKEDFLEIISQMRSSGGASTRSGSPYSPKSRTKATDILDGLNKSPAKDLECNIKQAQLSLKHFRDVVDKNKLEMLPGNGTIVLETVTAIHVLLKKYVLNEQSSTLVSATNQVYQSLANLIKLCDDYLLIGEKALDKENVTEIVNLVENAIQNLVSLARDKISLKDSNQKLSYETSSIHTKHKPRILSEKNTLDLSQRNSLPDIPLTPREREILEKTSNFVLERHSQSTENVLASSPPPKPPHPDRIYLDASYPPPLPPKKKQKNWDDLRIVKSSMECLSLRSKSPEDSFSLLSASGGSLDSVSSHGREENDFTEMANFQKERFDDFDSNAFVKQPNVSNDRAQNLFWDYSSCCPGPLLGVNPPTSLHPTADSPAFVSPGDRFSGSQAESGFVSVPSGRSSLQSYSASPQHLYSTRSSQQSYTSLESHHMEKKQLTTIETSSKVQSFTTENVYRESSTKGIATSTTSTEKLSCQQQAYTKSTTEVSSVNEVFWTEGDSSGKKLGDNTCYHEVKVIECPLHASSTLSSTHTSKIFKQSPRDDFLIYSAEDKPPALPEKTRSRIKRERCLSDQDHGKEFDCLIETSHERSLYRTTTENNAVSHKQQSSSILNSFKFNSDGLVQTARIEGQTAKTFDDNGEQPIHNDSSSISLSNSAQLPNGKPPPLPPKKKHMFQSVAYSVMAYMEIFGNASHANANEFLRHSVHAYNILQSEWQQHQKLLSSAQHCSFTLNVSHHSTPERTVDFKSDRMSMPPALPPKRRSRSSTSSPPHTPTSISSSEINKREELCEQNRDCAVDSSGEFSVHETAPETLLSTAGDLNKPETSPNAEPNMQISILDKLNVTEHLVSKKKDDEGPDIRGGHPDALVIHATKAHKNDFLYQEAFLTTYRTFMTPLELIQKLCYRYERFSSSQDSLKQRAARESFSLLVRVVSDLTLTDLEQVVLQTLMEFVQKLLCSGDLTMAKALRVIMLNKYEAKKLYMTVSNMPPSHNVYTRQSLLLDFKSEQIAEQMTLLDAELFLKIEIPEVLIWAQEQNEERSPNLTKFTEHFNKMSYWARSRILEQNDAKEREKYVVKFIKIMKHLRKINNFNSYLALLSALDSAPVRRLEWQKHITEGLKEYCALIDSSSSFRAYRQALAETHPPCIPYIGLVLQDLTFVHIGNTNNLPSGAINFSKRWQQFNIVENMKRFKKGGYPYKKNDKIIAFFNGFDDSLSEEAMWQISEKIKPRGGKKA